jgi:hypothetical protein
MPDNSYQETITAYTAQLRGLLAVPPGIAPDEAVRRGGAAVPSEVLAERAEQLMDISRQLGEMSAIYLEVDDVALREAAEMKLLAQSSAEVEVALALLQTASDEAQGQVRQVTRAGGSQRELEVLAKVLEAPLEEGMGPFVDVQALRRAAETTDMTLEEARQSLKDQVRRSLRAISRKAGKTSSLGLDTLFSLDSSLLKQGVSLASKEVGDLIEKVVKGFSELVKRLAASAVRLLLQAYDWVLALIGKDTETAARKKVHEWIEELRQSHTQSGDEEGLADKLVDMLYTTQKIQEDLGRQIDKKGNDVQTLTTTAATIMSLGSRYEAKASQMESFLRAAQGANRVLLALSTQFPNAAAGLPVVAAIVLALTGYTLFSGYDHVDTSSVSFFNRFQINIPDRVSGVSITVTKALAG